MGDLKGVGNMVGQVLICYWTERGWKNEEVDEEVDIHSISLLTTPIFVYLCING